MFKFINKIFKSLLKDRDGYISRKLAAAWILSFMTSLQLFLHIPVGIWFQIEIQQILSGSDFVQFLTIIWGSYFASDTVGSWIYEKGKSNIVESNEKTE